MPHSAWKQVPPLQAPLRHLPGIHGSDAKHLLTISAVAGSPEQPKDRGEYVLDILEEMVPFSGASISTWDVAAGNHRTVVRRYYTDTVQDYLNGTFVAEDKLFAMARESSRLLRWEDTPFPYREDLSAKSVFLPAGYDEGFSAPLYSAEGRYTGAIHLSVNDRIDLPAKIMPALSWLPSLVGPVADQLADFQAIRNSFLSHHDSIVLVSLSGKTIVFDQYSDTHRDPTPAEDIISNGLRRLMTASENQPIQNLLTYDHNDVLYKLTCVRHGSLLVAGITKTGSPRNLTHRELQVISLVTSGWTNYQLAHRMGIATRTVDKHIQNIFSKLSVSSRAELSVVAIQEGLILLDGTNVAD